MKHEKWFFLFLLLLPFIDLGTSLIARYLDVFVSIGTIVKGLFLFVMVGYLFFKSHSKYKKMSLIYFGLLFLFAIAYFVSKRDMDGMQLLIQEINYFVKFMFFPSIFICLLNYFDEHREVVQKLPNILAILAVIYTILLFLPYITDTAFSSYGYGEDKGAVGWFYAANEMGVLLLLLYPFLFKFVFEKKWITALFLFLTAFVIIMIGTKVSNFGLLFITIGFLVLAFFIKNTTGKWKIIVFLLVLNLFTVFFVYRSLDLDNIINKIPTNNTESPSGSHPSVSVPNNSNNNDNNYKYGSIADLFGSDLSEFMDSILSGRLTLFLNTYNIYYERPLVEKAFGIGFVNRSSIDDENIEKLIEIDFVDIALRYGFVGFILYFIPVFAAFFMTIRGLFKVKTMRKTILVYAFLVALAFGISSFAGHILGAPSVSLILAIIMALLCFIANKDSVVSSVRVYERKEEKV